MNKYRLAILIFLISCQAFSQEGIEIIFNIKGINNSKTWGKPKDSDFVSKTITKTDKDYYNKETIHTLKANVKSKYGNFSVVLLDYNKNNTFNDFRTISGTIGSDGINIIKHNGTLDNVNKNNRRFIYKNMPLIINGTSFKLMDLKKTSNNLYKATLLKTKVNFDRVVKNKNGVFIDKLHDLTLFALNKDSIQLRGQLKKGKYLFLNFTKSFNSLTIETVKKLKKYSSVLNIVNIEVADIKSSSNVDTYKQNVIYNVEKEDFDTIFKLGYNDNYPNGILFNDKGEVVLHNISTDQVIYFLNGLSKQKTAIKTKLNTVSIHYNIGKYVLTKAHKTEITSFLKTLDSTMTYKVKIISSADYLGSIKSNFVLANKRAIKIKIFLQNTSPSLFESIESVNKGEVVEHEKEQMDKLIGNVENRKTSILFLKKEVTKKKRISIAEKKVYIYNPKKEEFDLRIGKKFILKKLIFKRGTAIMQQRSKSSLKGLLRFLKENPNVEIEIQGHLCCNSGNYQPDKSKVKPYPSIHLSTKRARFVYKYLVINGIRNKRLTYHGYGFQSPIYYPEKTQKHKSLNKRVEILITKF